MQYENTDIEPYNPYSPQHSYGKNLTLEPEQTSPVNIATIDDILSIDHMELMPNKDGTGPKGGGKQDGSGGGSGNQGQGGGGNKSGSGQGSKTGGNKGGRN